MATIARNIGPVGRRARVIGGAALLVAGVAGAVLLVLGGFARGARVALFAPFFGAALGLLQARDHTCVMLAVRNQCEVVGRGLGAVTDGWLAGQLRRQARELLVESALIALFVTGIVLLIPG
jgi:hypothetical protein